MEKFIMFTSRTLKKIYRIQQPTNFRKNHAPHGANSGRACLPLCYAQNALKTLFLCSALLWQATTASAQMSTDPETGLVVPSVGQMAWHEDEMAVFFHMNPTFPVDTMTFANFNPVAVIDAAESVGAKHIVVVCKHVNGFCWWPTEATKPGDSQNTSNIALTQYNGGTGDVVRAIFDEARSRGIRPGVYLATRDDHFGAGEKGSYPSDQQAYIDYYMTQATELATQYGELAEWWLDGSTLAALGGEINALLATHQPNAVVFQGTAATLRWIGNEGGTAAYPSWNTISQSAWDSIQNSGSSVSTGDPDGVRWVPAEVDTSIASGWFGGGPRSLADLQNVYYNSVGHGTGLLLNFPVQADGSIHPNNIARGVELGAAIDNAVGHPLFSTGPHEGSSLTLDLGSAVEIDHVIVEEDLQYGERIRAFDIDGWDGSQWVPITSGTAIGRKQIRKFSPTTWSKVRLTVTSSVGTARIRSLSVTRTGVQAPDTTPPTTPVGLSATVIEDQVDLSWQAASDPESGIDLYRIYRDDVLVGTTTHTTFHDPSSQENQTYSYRVSAMNGFGLEGLHSDPAPAATGIDQTPPSVLSASTLPGRAALSVIMSETIEQASAENMANYQVSHGHSVSAITFAPAEPDRVVLSLDGPLSPDILHTLTMSSIKDDAATPNEIAPGTETDILISTYGLVRHWKLDEGSGTTAMDSVAGDTAPGNNAQLVGATWTTAGRRNGALSFDGKDHANAGLAGLQVNFTIALWVRPKSTSGSQVLIGKDRNGASAYQQRLYLTDRKPGFLMSDEDSNDFGLWPFEYDTPLPLNEWSHLAVVNDGDTFRLYVNGTLVLTKQLGEIIQSPYNPAELLFGARWNSAMTGTVDHFTGSLDDIRIYTEPLPSEEILQIIAEADPVDPDPDSEFDPATSMSISINFIHDDGQIFSVGEMIGPLASDSTYWNSAIDSGTGSFATGSRNGLIDDVGSNTYTDISWSSLNTYFTSENDTIDDEHKLSKGYLDDGGSGLSITVENIPYESYKVYGLFSSGVSDNGESMIGRDFLVNGTWAYGGEAPASTDVNGSITVNQTVNGEYWTETLPGVVIGNYWVVETSGSTLSISGLNSGEGRGSLAGLIIEKLKGSEPVTDLAISGPVSGGHAIEISWTGEYGSTYTVETNADLASGTWGTYTSNIPGTGTMITYTNSSAEAQMFFRIVSE